LKIKIGAANPIVPTQEMFDALPEIAELWDKGYVKLKIGIGLEYPYKILYKLKGSEVWVDIDLKESEFRYLPTKPFDKNDWL